uniref:Uncharacterized protein n=1 Tax=Arundo donax TaxID=35708 RepID=A0A0A8ZG91_ARUDO
MLADSPSKHTPTSIPFEKPAQVFQYDGTNHSRVKCNLSVFLLTKEAKDKTKKKKRDVMNETVYRCAAYLGSYQRHTTRITGQLPHISHTGF